MSQYMALDRGVATTFLKNWKTAFVRASSDLKEPGKEEEVHEDTLNIPAERSR